MHMPPSMGHVFALYSPQLGPLYSQVMLQPPDTTQPGAKVLANPTTKITMRRMPLKLLLSRHGWREAFMIWNPNIPYAMHEGKECLPPCILHSYLSNYDTRVLEAHDSVSIAVGSWTTVGILLASPARELRNATLVCRSAQERTRAVSLIRAGVTDSSLCAASPERWRSH